MSEKSIKIKKRDELKQKPFLNYTELKIYLGLSRCTLDQLIRGDPSFPLKKTPRKWARVQIDEWLLTPGSNWFVNLEPKALKPIAHRFKLDIQSLN